MKTIQKTLLYSFSIFLLNFSSAYAGEDTPYEENKTIYKAFKITDKLELDLLSKYGDVTIDTWDKDSVSFTIDIKVITDNPETSKEFIKDVTVLFNHSEDYISASTEWNRYTNKIRKTAIDFATILGRERKIEVNYSIKLPANSELDIENSFGDITLNDFEGKIKIEASHGNVRIRKVKNIKKLKLSYGKLKIKEYDNANIEIHSTDADIEEGKTLTLKSSSSDIEIEKVKKLILNSKHDKIEVDEIDKLTFTSAWSDIDIDELKTTIQGDIKYGDFSVEKISSSFQDIKINGHATDIELFFVKEIAFHYNISLVNGKRFSIPSTGNTTTKSDTFEDLKEYEGTFATIPLGGKPASAVIKAKASYIDFRLTD